MGLDDKEEGDLAQGESDSFATNRSRVQIP